MRYLLTLIVAVVGFAACASDSEPAAVPTPATASPTPSRIANEIPQGVTPAEMGYTPDEVVQRHFEMSPRQILAFCPRFNRNMADVMDEFVADKSLSKAARSQGYTPYEVIDAYFDLLNEIC